jgi:hypothetical protein
VAGRPLRPATDRSLGRPLPHQPANPTRSPPRAHHCFPHAPDGPWSYAVLAAVSGWYPPPRGRFSTRSSPVRHSRPKPLVRLACLRHAASVCPEPGSNSPSKLCPRRVHLMRFLDWFGSCMQSTLRPFSLPRSLNDSVFGYAICLSRCHPSKGARGNIQSHKMGCQPFLAGNRKIGQTQPIYPGRKWKAHSICRGPSLDRRAWIRPRLGPPAPIRPMGQEH